MRGKLAVILVLMLVLATSTLGLPRPATAAHESTNSLVFAPVPGSTAPMGEGTGVIAFGGGVEPDTRWTATFAFRGLQPGTAYVVVIQGRTGDDQTADAEVFSPICTLRVDETGAGGCWHYFLGMRRLAVAQVRLGDTAGPTVLQASRAPTGPGSITGVPNRNSPPPASPVASPVASPPATPTRA